MGFLVLRKDTENLSPYLLQESLLTIRKRKNGRTAQERGGPR